MRTLTIAVAAAAALAGVIIPAEQATAAPPPNVVIFITDDQAEGTLDAMPALRGQIRAQGATLNGVIPTSICCPSRTTLLSGQYSRHTGVYENVGPHGGWPTFYESGAEDRTIAVQLDNAGYHTGLFGKYLNGYALADPAYVPPGWDTFRAIRDDGDNPALGAGAYYGYTLHGTGEDVHYGNTAADYSTDVITKESVQFINQAPADQPLFLYYSTSGPHSPWEAAPRHVGTWRQEELNPAAYTLTKNRPAFWPDVLLNPDIAKENVQAAHETLMSVDEGIASVINALGDRASNTLFVFLSDNGLQFAEHGLSTKNVPYSGSTDVPMFLRWDGVIPAGITYNSLVTNADLTATIAEAAGVSTPNPDGVSVFAPARPVGVALEGIGNGQRPAYCGWRTNRYVYVEYDGKGREFYDYKRDPNELVNVVKADRYQVRVDAHRQAAIAACNPVPPGFAW